MQLTVDVPIWKEVSLIGVHLTSGWMAELSDALVFHTMVATGRLGSVTWVLLTGQVMSGISWSAKKYIKKHLVSTSLKLPACTFNYQPPMKTKTHTKEIRCQCNSNTFSIL